MSFDWSYLTLENSLEALIDYRGKTPVKTASGVPLITAKIIKGGRIETPTEFIAIDNYEEWMRRGIPKSGDVVLTVEAPLGEVAQLGDEKVALAQRVVTLRGKLGVLDNTYLLYLLQTEDLQSKLRARATGTTVIGIKQSELRKIDLKLPPISIQVISAATLKTLDERITLLRDTNVTLENIAQTIFKSWFVDFDPVHIKQQARTSESINEETAAIFPSEFEESELGLIPRGWAVKKVSEVAEIIKGKSYSSKDLTTAHHTALVSLKSFERGGGFRLDGFKPYTGNFRPNQIVVPGDLIIAYTDVTQAAELIGKPAIVVGVSDYQTLVASLDVGIVKPYAEISHRQFLYGLFRTDAFQAHTFAHTTGTTVLHLAKDGVGSFKFICPPIEVVKAFAEIGEAITARVQINIDQIRTLSNLRDTLLPRLISGQLSLQEATP